MHKKETEKINIGIKEIQNIKMTLEEKENILHDVLSSPISPIQPIRSPWTIFSFMSSGVAYYGTVFCLVLIIGSGGVIFSSQKSLPGSTLYPLKVKIFEPINLALKFSPELKAQYESSLATERLVEAETLIYQGKFDSTKEQQLAQLLTNHTEALDQKINELYQNELNEEARSVVVNFQADMNAHAQVLDIMNEQNEQVDINTQTEETPSEEVQIATIARTNAESIGTSFERNIEETTPSEENEEIAFVDQATIETQPVENNQKTVPLNNNEEEKIQGNAGAIYEDGNFENSDQTKTYNETKKTYTENQAEANVEYPTTATTAPSVNTISSDDTIIYGYAGAIDENGNFENSDQTLIYNESNNIYGDMPPQSNIEENPKTDNEASYSLENNSKKEMPSVNQNQVIEKSKSETPAVKTTEVRTETAVSTNDEQAIQEYSQRKNYVESLINSISYNLNIINPDGSLIKQRIVGDAQKTIARSRQLLNEANELSDIGDFKKANSLILKAESSIKEAEIFLKTGMQFYN